MPSISLELDNRPAILETLRQDGWFVACLCAAWCDVCCQYRPGFEQLALEHPDKLFLWIDIEDQADIVGDFDVENFPTLLIQRGDTVAFFGTVQPDLRQANRLIQSIAGKNTTELQAEIRGNTEREQWQQTYNLRSHLGGSLGQ